MEAPEPVYFAERLTARDERRIAVAADVDPRTVRARWRGARQSLALAAAIDRAARSLGFEPPPRPDHNARPKAA